MAPQKVSFGDLGAYSGGFDIPEGDYAIEHTVQMYAPTKTDGTKAGVERLGVMLKFYPLAGGDPLEKFLSMGGKADQSYAPDPETGKGVIPVAGGAGAGLNNKTNWFLYLKSLYDCGLPPGVFDNDLTTIDGVWCHIQSVPEPEDRKGFGSRTGEAEEERKAGKIPVCTEIKDDGKPWEGTGGIPEVTEKPKVVKAGPKAVVKAAPAKPAAVKAKPAPAPVATAEGDDEDLKAQALTAMAAVLEKNPKGCAKVVLRTGVYKAIKDNEVGQQVLDTFFGDDDLLGSLLGDLGYTVAGMMIKPAA